MPQPEKIAILRTSYPAAVHAYIADIPPEGDVTSLSLRGPIEIPAYHEPVEGSFTIGSPVYNEQSSEILWPCRRGRRSDGQSDNVSVWRLGRHFYLSSIEQTPIAHMPATGPASLILENDSYTVAVAVTPNLTKPGEVKMARRGPNHDWATLPFLTTSKVPFLHHAQLYKPPIEGSGQLMYVFYVQPKSQGEGVALIDMLEEARIPELAKPNSGIMWRRFEVNLGFSISRELSVIVIQDESPDEQEDAKHQSNGPKEKHRLYMFSKVTYPENGIQYCYVPLQADGSMASYKTAFNASGRQFIPCDADDIKVLKSGGRLLLLWVFDAGHEEEDGVDAWSGLSGRIGPGASLPDANGWTEIKIGFENEQVPNEKHTLLDCRAVVVLSNYE